jgi:hypothetical protein
MEGKGELVRGGQTMAITIDYASATLQRSKSVSTGHTAAVLAVCSAVLVIFLSFNFRMNMAKCVGWCGNPRMQAETSLYATGLLLFVPAIATVQSLLSGKCRRVCRTSLAVAACGWLFYVISTRIGLPY